jgi:hypothetical protein
MKTDRYVIVKKASNGFILSLLVENDDGDEKVKSGIASNGTLGAEIEALFRTKIRTKKGTAEEVAPA